MSRLRAALFFIPMAIATAFGCAASAADPDSETHWLRSCNVDSDCGQGLSCLCNTCTLPCGVSNCKGLGANASCVTPTAEALVDDCQLAPGIALCAKACSKDADCSATGAGLRCIGGACLVGAPTSSAGRSTVGDGGNDASASRTSVSTWVADFEDAFCTWGIRCGEFPDGATCHASNGHRFVTEGFNSASAAVTAVSKGTAQFDGAAATACLAALSQLDCSPSFYSNLPSLPAPCASAFSGHLPDGATCIDDVECATGSVCLVQSTVTCEGTCKPGSAVLGGSCETNADCPGDQYCEGVGWWGPGFWLGGSCNPVTPPGADGEPCGMPVQCAPGFSCSGGPAPALCGPASAAAKGDSCGGFNGLGPACAPGLVCAQPDEVTPGTCMPEAKLGEPCTSLFQCGAQYFFNDLICDMVGSHTCVRRPSAGSCVLVSGMNTCNPATSYCDGSGKVGTCKPWPSLNAPCTFPTNGPDPCGPNASCQGGRCVSTVAPVCIPK